MLPRTHLIRIQRSIYDKLREHASLMLGGLSPDLKHYFREYQRDFQTFKELSTKRELLSELSKAQIVFCGDYHTLSQAQRSLIRLLREVHRLEAPTGRPTCLGLEMLTASDEKFAALFLQAKLSESEFLKKVGFKKHWGFAWENYRGLFEFARTHDVQIMGLHPPRARQIPTLKVRDNYAAKRIVEYTQRHPQDRLVVLVGDLHLAQKHLPGSVQKELARVKARREMLTIHQNNEKLYWQLVEAGLEQFVDVLKVRAGVYCVMNTPPWVKLQSHLKWAELIAESGKVPHVEAPSEAFDSLDYSDEVTELVAAISHFLDLPLPKTDNFEIFGPLDIALLDRLQVQGRFTLREVEMLKNYASVFKSQFIPGANILCLNSLGLNHLASLSSLYLHATLSGFDHLFLNPNEDFYQFVWVEALGYFGSKILNPKRRCNGYLDLKRNLMARHPAVITKPVKEDEVAAMLALAALDQELGEPVATSQFCLYLPREGKQNILYYKVAKILGHLLGDALYHGVMDARVDRSEVAALFRFKFESQRESLALYRQWTQRLDAYGYRESVKMHQV